MLRLSVDSSISLGCFPRLPLARRRCLTSKVFASMASVSKKVLVPVANGTEPMEAVIVIDVLRRSGAEVTVAAVANQLKVNAGHRIKIIADALIDDCADCSYDLIALPGGMPGAVNFKECKVLENLVKKQSSEEKLYAAVCASPAVALASWGVLDGIKATCYPSFMDQLKSSAIAVEARVQRNRNLITSRGPGTTLEFAIELVEALHGQAKADEIVTPLVMRWTHGGEHFFKELNSIDWKCSNIPQILVPVANGSEEMEATIIIDILRRAEANVIVASVEDSAEITASRKVKLEADMLLDDAVNQSYDLIVLPGGLGGAQSFAKSDKLITLLHKQKECDKPYGAICASPALVLEPHGLLKGKKATAFPAMCDGLTDKSEIQNRVIVDGNLITSRGPGTSMEFALAIVEKFYGREKAVGLAKIMLFTEGMA